MKHFLGVVLVYTLEPERKYTKIQNKLLFLYSVKSVGMTLKYNLNQQYRKL